MIWTLIKKEIQESIVDFRFWIGTLLCMLLIPLGMYVSIKSLGQSIIDGVEIERFQTTDPNFIGDAFGQGDAKIELWVDMKTRLPVRLELEINKQDMIRVHVLADDFDWDASIDPAEFKPVIPDDYTVGQPPMIIAPQTKPKRTIPSP